MNVYRLRWSCKQKECGGYCVTEAKVESLDHAFNGVAHEPCFQCRGVEKQIIAFTEWLPVPGEHKAQKSGSGYL